MHTWSGVSVALMLIWAARLFYARVDGRITLVVNS